MLCLTGAFRESVRIWVHRFSPIFRPSRRVRRLVAVGETVLKVNGQTCYLCTNGLDSVQIRVCIAEDFL
jgi:transposase-like protein